MKAAAEAVGRPVTSVGEHPVLRGMRAVRPAGADGKANVGMSNDNAGANPARRKTKGSRPTIIGPGSVGS